MAECGRAGRGTPAPIAASAPYARGQRAKQDFGEALPPPRMTSASCTPKVEVWSTTLGRPRWCREAADQGRADAQYNPGSRYFHGAGLQLDYGEAMRWWRKVADQRHCSP